MLTTFFTYWGVVSFIYWVVKFGVMNETKAEKEALEIKRLERVAQEVDRVVNRRKGEWS